MNDLIYTINILCKLYKVTLFDKNDRNDRVLEETIFFWCVWVAESRPAPAYAGIWKRERDCVRTQALISADGPY